MRFTGLFSSSQFSHQFVYALFEFFREEFYCESEGLGVKQAFGSGTGFAEGKLGNLPVYYLRQEHGRTFAAYLALLHANRVHFSRVKFQNSARLSVSAILK